MVQGSSKKISELPTVNSVSNSDLLIVNANVSGNVTTSAISIDKFVNSSVGNVYSYSNYVVYSSANSIVQANSATPVEFFTYNRTLYAGVKLTIDAKDTSNNRTFGEILLTSNSTVANCTASVVTIGSSPINVIANSSVSGNTVSLSLSQTGSTANINLRYTTLLFKV
jgi:hypothetical protein